MTQPQSTRKSKLLLQLWNFSKFVTVLCTVWLLGYHGLSVAWVGVVSVFIYIWMFENYQFNLSFRQPQTSHQMLQAAHTEETLWLNKILQQLWPYTKEKVDIFMRHQLQNSIRKNLPSTLKSFIFTNIDLGVQVPQVLAVDVKESDKEYVIIDLEVLYNSDADIGLSIGKLESSIREVQVHGTLRVVLTELNSLWPFFGKMNLSFVTAPSLSFRLAKAASILNIAGFRDIIHETISDQLTSLLVLPHFLTIPLNNDYKSSTSYPLPQGVLRVHVNRAKDIANNDQADCVDPYCVIQVGASRCKSGVIQKTDHPMWNESFEFLVNDSRNQFVEVECIDAADTSGIGSLGSCYINVASLVESSGKNVWLTLDKSTGGSISITPTWLQLSEDASRLTETELVGCQWTSVAVVSVGVESAASLPDLPGGKGQRALRSLSKPCPYVKITLGCQEKLTKVSQASNSPSWGENFYLLSSDPRKQNVICQVIDDVTDAVLGTATVPLAGLIEHASVQTTSYQLTSKAAAASEASLTLTLSLKVLVNMEAMPSTLKSGELPIAEDTAFHSVSYRTIPSMPSPLPIPATFQKSETVSTPVRAQKLSPLLSKEENDNSSGEQLDLLDFDNWSETASNGVITGGATYIVISRPDGATVSEIVQNADESMSCGKENLSFDDTLFGKIQITLRYSTTQQRLMIVVHQCCNLIPMKTDKDTQPDPFVVMTLYNGRTKVDRKKTKSQKATLNPVFDETFEFKLLKPNLGNAMLELSIKNKKRVFQKKKSSMGSVLLRVEALDLSEARTDWFLVRSMRESTESLSGGDLTQSFASRS